MRTETAPDQTPTRLADYRAPDWLIDRVSLVFDLAANATRVRSTIAFRRNGSGTSSGPADLELFGRKLTLVSAEVDGQDVMDRVETDREGLRLAGPLPDSFTWTCETEIDPEANTELEGLYMSKRMYCTQCEAEGFRKITYYPDRPDVMAVFDVRIEADIVSQPILLSNGNPVEQGRLPGGRHFAEWHDPHPKPSYLFALVAGDLISHDDTFTTASGRNVDLKIYVRPGDEAKCAYAMDVLKRSMRWDEEAYGLEYDLDLFMIVAVDDFNMGAMENKGLNIFNSKYVLASPETATDLDFELIESIIAHEYFHNWTGNRITCRDWFQLCLKEGLTVFRDQQFSGDMRSAAQQRIGDVQALRARQFREDAGPLAHPVRPEEYVEINNFYTATVYEKGAEVIRMLHTLIGPEAYRKGTDLYFQRHDGQACTIEDWIQVFEDATGRDLSQFALWYRQAGTPKVHVSGDWEETGGVYTLTLTQELPETPGQTDKAPQVLPLAVGLLGHDGAELMPTTVLEMTEGTQTFRFPSLPAEPVVSFNRGFSAPVIVERAQTDAERAFLLAHDTDPFARWEAGRRYAIDLACRVIDGAPVDAQWTDASAKLLSDPDLDPAFKAMALGAPGADEMAAEVHRRGGLVDPDAVHAAQRAMHASLGTALQGPLTETYHAMQVPGPYTPDAADAAKRALANRCLGLLAETSADGLALAEAQFVQADNMTQSMTALRALVHNDAPGAADALTAFHDRWRQDPLVIDKWLSLQASAPGDTALERVRALTDHPSFDWTNPNKFRSLVGVFAMANPTAFHAADGSGYAFFTDWLIKLDGHNPQTTARLAGAFESWRRYTQDRQDLIGAQLGRIAAVETLSKNTREIVERIQGA
ncbi:MAG: aminopeptidase N [Pseudomonadota bacterium]